ncbi:MAG: hypothetical protein FWF37_04170 [Chloroflexi bacterium]|nr:hypothetical protein [Chloroflexota bacterium]
MEIGTGDIEAAADNLMKFEVNINTARMRELFFLIMLTATETVFQMKNGVWIIHLSYLKKLIANVLALSYN